VLKLELEVLKEKIIELADDKKGFNIEILEIGKLSSIADYFIVIEGTSLRHLKTIAESIISSLKKEDIYPISNEGIAEKCDWIVIDYGSIVVHLFEEEMRKKIDLESFWKKEIFQQK
jgi:ribosome-associated protein